VSLISANSDANGEQMTLLAIRANNAPEMQLKIQQALAAVAQTLRVWDIQIIGTGAAPNFLAVLTLANSEGFVGGLPRVQVSAADVVVAAGIDPIDIAEQVTATLLAEIGGTQFKGVSAGGGFGPHWMGLALYTPN
jgi:hypothetical protein